MTPRCLAGGSALQSCGGLRILAAGVPRSRRNRALAVGAHLGRALLVEDAERGASSSRRSVPARRALVDPAFELDDRDQDRLRAAADDAQLGLDVLVEEVAADAEHRRGLVRDYRHAAESALRPAVRLGRRSGGEIEPELLAPHIRN